MKGHPFRIRLPRKLVSSVQFRFAVTFTVLVAILLTLINTYPTRASRDIVFAEKQSALTNRAAVVSSSLSLLDNLTPDNTRQVLALLDLRDLTRIVVTDSTGLAVYDSAAENNIRGKYTLYPELVRGHIEIDPERRSAHRFGQNVELTLKEFDLTELLMRNPGKVYSREQLLDLVWGYDYQGDIRTVDVHIRRLREKLERNPAAPEYIITKLGVGYYFAEA